MIDLTVCERMSCTGCTACFSSCPKHCINMKEDEYGFLHPYINASLCIHCNACKNVCPQNSSNLNYHYPIDCYAVRANNVEKRKKSTSGGSAIALLEAFVLHGGVVYCSSFDNGIIAIRRFSQSNFSDNLVKIRGSKYAQALLDDAFSNIKNDLSRDLKVLFISTPCQVDGLFHFLGKAPENLYTVDLVCHGVPSQKMLFDHLKTYGLQIENISNISFRKGPKYYLSAFNGSQIVYSKNLFYDKYLEGFLSNLSLRESCFSCLYARPERVGDITIGDFWGLSSDCELKIEDGVNLVLVNTTKGKELFSLFDDKVEFEKRTVGEAVNGNAQLMVCSKPHKNRIKFRKMYLKRGFDKAIVSSRKFRTRIRYLPLVRKFILKRYE